MARVKTKIITTLLAVTMAFSLTACRNQDDIDNAVNEATTPLNAQITELNANIAEKEAKITTLEGEKTALTAEKTELEADITALEAEKADLEAEKAALEAEVSALEAEKASLTTDKATLEASISAKNNEIENLNSSISALETEKANLEEQVTILEASISAKETEITDLTSSVATLTAEKQTLTDRVAELESENEALESEKSELEKENETLKNCVKGNHSGTLSYTSTNDGTQHTATYSCCGTTVTEDHSGGTATCLVGKICEICGFEYDETTNPENHASDVYTYTDNEDDATHTKIHECGTVLNTAEAHTVTTWTHDNGRHTGNCDHCDASLSGYCDENMDSTTGRRFAFRILR